MNRTYSVLKIFFQLQQLRKNVQYIISIYMYQYMNNHMHRALLVSVHYQYRSDSIYMISTLSVHQCALSVQIRQYIHDQYIISTSSVHQCALSVQIRQYIHVSVHHQYISVHYQYRSDSIYMYQYTISTSVCTISTDQTVYTCISTPSVHQCALSVQIRQYIHVSVHHKYISVHYQYRSVYTFN